MEELNPWDEGYQAPQAQPQVQPQAELNPWDEGYTVPQANAPEDTPVLSGYSKPEDLTPTIPVEDRVDSRGVPGGPDYVAPPEQEDLSFSMYEGQTPEQAYKKYEEVKSRPDTQTSIFGEPIVDNTIVPTPEPNVNLTTDPTAEPGMLQMTSNAARGAIKNVAMTAAASIDELGRRDGYDWGLTEKVDKAIANRAKGGEAHPMQEVAMQLSEYASGAVAGYKIGNKAGSLMTGGNYSPRNAANFFAKALGSFGSMIGAVTSQDANTQTMVTGPDAFIGTIFQGVPQNPDGTLSESVLAKKTNLLLDEMTGAFAGAKLGQAVQAAGTVVKHIIYDQIKPLWNAGTREMEAVDNLMGALNLQGDEGVDAVRQAIDDHMDVWLKVAGKDAMPMNRTTMSAINEGMKETNPVAARRAMEVESALTPGSYPNLASRQELPMKEFDKFQTDMMNSRGGFQTIENTRETLAQQGINEVNVARDAPIMQEANVRRAEENVREGLRNDPIFGAAVKDAETSPNKIAVNRTKTVHEDRFAEGAQDAADTINRTTNENYAKIPAGTKIDDKSFKSAMKEADPYLPKSVRDLIGDEGTVLDYKTLKANILPEVREALYSMKNADTKYRNDVGIRALELLEDNIAKKQLALQPKAVQDISNEADKYFKEVKLPFRESKTVGPLFDKTLDKEAKLNAQQAIPNAVKDSKKGTNTIIMDLINRPEYKGDKNDLVKVAIGDKFKDIYRKGIDDINPDDLTNSLRDIGVFLEDNYPQGVKLVEDAANRLTAAKGNVKLEKEILKEVRDISKEAEERVFGSVLGKFIKKGAGTDISKEENGYQIFKSLLTGQKNGKQIEDIVKRVQASGDPIAQDGLETAYLTYLRDRISEGSLGFSEKQASRLTADPTLDSLVEYGKKIFRNPDEVDDYGKVVKTLQNERDKRVPDGIVLNSKGGLMKSAMNASRIGINLAFGVLNPTSTKMKTVANLILGGSGVDEKAAKIMDFIASDKEYAKDLLTKYANYKNNEFGDEAKSVLWKLAIASGAYTDKDRKTFDKDWEEQKKKPVDKETDNLK